MIPNSSSGLFIDIEGLDGSGSSTQVELAAGRLRKEGVKVYTTKEPTNNIIGGLIRGALTKVVELPPESLQLLFAADRGHHLEREILPMIKNNAIAITDRYAWSTIAFGSIDLEREWLFELNKHFLFPDITFILKVNPRLCFERMKKDRFDYELFEEVEKLEKIWRCYQWLAKKFNHQKMYIINGERKKEEITAEIVEKIKRHEKYRKLRSG